MANDMIYLHTAEQMKEAVDQKGLSVVLWSADWCPDCVYLKPYLPVIMAKHPEFRFYHMDRDENLDAAIEQGVQGIPSFIVFEDGKEIARLVNGLRKTPTEINDFLNQAKEKSHAED